MLPSPVQVDAYSNAWADIMARVRNGYSWSGNERNCAYLNTGKGTCVDVSAITGFHFPDDGRAMALTDWDQDGDLDVWLRNRTAPRLRLLINQCKQRDSLALNWKDQRAIGMRLVRSL